MNKERMLDVFRFMWQQPDWKKEPIKSSTVRRALRKMGFSVIYLPTDEIEVIVDVLNRAMELEMTQEDAEQELDIICMMDDPIVTGSSDSKLSTDLIKIKKRLTGLFKELSDIENDLRITEDVLSMTTNYLLENMYPDEPFFIDKLEEVGSSLMVVEDRLHKIHSDIENLPLKCKEEQPE